MSYVTGGMLTVGNIDAIAYAIANIDSEAPFLEIGSFCGLSSNLITFLKQDAGKRNKLIAFDPWDYASWHEEGETFANFNQITWAEYTEFVKNAYRTRVGFFSSADLPFAIQGYSGQIFEKWAAEESVIDVFQRPVALGGSISFAFIDGDHTYEGALSDFKNVDRYLEIGGFILFDDSADGSNWGCARVAREVSQRSAYELISKNPNYLIKKVS